MSSRVIWSLPSVASVSAAIRPFLFRMPPRHERDARAAAPASDDQVRHPRPVARRRCRRSRSAGRAARRASSRTSPSDSSDRAADAVAGVPAEALDGLDRLLLGVGRARGPTARSRAGGMLGLGSAAIGRAATGSERPSYPPPNLLASTSATSTSSAASRSRRRSGVSAREEREAVEVADRRPRRPGASGPRHAVAGQVEDASDRRSPPSCVGEVERPGGTRRRRARTATLGVGASTRRRRASLDLGARVRVVGQPLGRPATRSPPVATQRPATVGRLLGARRCAPCTPTSKRTSPPPTSLPRSMSTTPNVAVAGEAVVARARGSAARTRAAAAAGAGRSTVPSGNIGSVTAGLDRRPSIASQADQRGAERVLHATARRRRCRCRSGPARTSARPLGASA